VDVFQGALGTTVRTYITIYFGAAIVVMGIMPIVTRFARAVRILDDPGTRKVHRSSVPRIGGLPILIGMLVLTLPSLALDNRIGLELRETSRQVAVLLSASAFMFLIGLADDIRSLRARTKLAAQLLAAATVCAFGMRVDSITAGGLTIQFGWLSWPVTMLWIVGVTNAVNLIDGLDGLAAGICAVTCGVIAVFSFYTGQVVMAVLVLALLGSLTGFLFFNFNPAKIFMGDCGTLFVGFFLASASVMCTAKSLTLVGLALPALALGLPIFDTLLSILRRVLERRSIFSPDRNHIHHRMLVMGLNHRSAVIVMYAVTLCAASLGMFMMILRDVSAVVVFLVVSLLLLAVFRFTGAVRLRESLDVLKHNLSLAHRARGERRDFESLQLRMREVTCFQEWWGVLCAAAERMDFFWLGLAVQNGHRTTYRSSWDRSGIAGSRDDVVRMSLPICRPSPRVSLRLDATVGVNGSLEDAGRRTTLFERLIDEHSLSVTTDGSIELGPGDIPQLYQPNGERDAKPRAGLGDAHQEVRAKAPQSADRKLLGSASHIRSRADRKRRVV